MRVRISAILLLPLLAACGQAGSLYLPDKPVPAPVPKPVSVTPVPDRPAPEKTSEPQDAR